MLRSNRSTVDVPGAGGSFVLLLLQLRVLGFRVQELGQL